MFIGSTASISSFAQFRIFKGWWRLWQGCYLLPAKWHYSRNSHVECIQSYACGQTSE